MTRGQQATPSQPNLDPIAGLRNLNGRGSAARARWAAKEPWAAALPQGVKQWTLTTLRDKLIKIGAKVVHHARRVVFQMAVVAFEFGRPAWAS